MESGKHKLLSKYFYVMLRFVPSIFSRQRGHIQVDFNNIFSVRQGIVSCFVMINNFSPPFQSKEAATVLTITSIHNSNKTDLFAGKMLEKN